VDLTPTALLLESNANVELPGLISRLPLQLVIVSITCGVERSPLERVPHSTPGLGTVTAIPKSALGCDLLDIPERAADPFLVLQEEDRPHSLRVDQHPPSREKMETPSRGRMTTSVIGANPLNPLGLFPQKRVHDRRFPHARRAHERDGPPGPEVAHEFLESARSPGARHEDGRSRRGMLDRFEQRSRIFTEITLG